MRLLITGVLFLFICACGSQETKKEQAEQSFSNKKSSKRMLKTSKPTVAENSMTCSLGKDNRTIGIEKNGNSCIVKYTKAGNTTEPARAKSDLNYCQKKANQIKTNLEKYGFKCN